MWQIAIPIAMKIAGALANQHSAGKYEKKARKAQANDALVAALSQGQVQSDSTPDYKPSKLGAALNIGGDIAAMFGAQIGGLFKGNPPMTESVGTSPMGELSPGDPSEMLSSYGQSRIGPLAQETGATSPMGDLTPGMPHNFYGSSRVSRRSDPSDQFMPPEWRNNIPLNPSRYSNQPQANAKKQSLLRRLFGGRN